MDTKKLMFEIAGGKYEPDGEVNYKYINSTDSAEEALRMYAGVDDYPFSYLRLIIKEDGARTEHTLVGDKTDAEYSSSSAKTVSTTRPSLLYRELCVLIDFWSTELTAYDRLGEAWERERQHALARLAELRLVKENWEVTK